MLFYDFERGSKKTRLFKQILSTGFYTLVLLMDSANLTESFTCLYSGTGLRGCYLHKSV